MTSIIRYSILTKVKYYSIFMFYIFQIKYTTYLFFESLLQILDTIV